MKEADVRRIVKDEMAKNYKSGSPDVAPHSHNGNDGLQLVLNEIQGVSSVPANKTKYMSPITGLPELGFAANLTGGDSSHDSQQYATPQITAIVPIPIIQGNGGGAQSAFNGGHATDGTVVLFANGNTLSTLNVYYGGEWYQFSVDSVI